jgi:hypothetical protein
MNFPTPLFRAALRAKWSSASRVSRKANIAVSHASVNGFRASRSVASVRKRKKTRLNRVVVVV